jgi:heat shock protein HslJ
MRACGHRVLIAAGLALALAACATDPSPSAAGRPAIAMTTPTTQELLGTEWLLEDLAGAGVIDRAEATLAFPEAGRAAGSGSCNRFTGAVDIGTGTMRFGPIAVTRRACVPAVMDQETKYLKALQAAERIARDGPYLLLYSKGLDRPLRFTRKP